jgi:uncharacterized protein (TIGR02588 family)
VARRKQVRAKLAERTPIAEWVAAALGLLLTLSVLGYLVWEGVSREPGPPSFQVEGEPPQVTAGGFAVPVVVRNTSHATAASVQVRGTLEQGDQVIEERRASLAYVPGRGEAKGGLVFQHDPRRYRLRLVAEGYEDP